MLAAFNFQWPYLAESRHCVKSEFRCLDACMYRLEWDNATHRHTGENRITRVDESNSGAYFVFGSFRWKLLEFG